MHDMKLANQIARHKIAGHENAKPENAGNDISACNCVSFVISSLVLSEEAQSLVRMQLHAGSGMEN